MKKQNMEYPLNRTLFSHKNEVLPPRMNLVIIMQR